VSFNELTQPDAAPAPAPARWPWGFSIALAIVLGGLFGVLAKQADEVDVLGFGQITSTLGVWILLIAFVGFVSATLARATGCSTVVVLTAVLAYYARQWQQFHYVPQHVAAVWCLLSVTGAPALAAACYQVRRPGWPAAAAVGLPTSLLVAEALPRLLAAPVIQPYVWVDLAGVGLLVVFGLIKGVRVARLAAVILVAASAATVLLGSVWSTVGGLG
jgi:Family of unknown function (DUF6518)